MERTMNYKGCKIVVDKNFDGTDVVYVETTDGGDPIEVIGGIADAKALIDQMIADLAEAHNHDDDE
jgi:hypothetical protein